MAFDPNKPSLLQPRVNPWAAEAATGNNLLAKGAGLLGRGAGVLGRAAGPLGAAYSGAEELNNMFGPGRIQKIQQGMQDFEAQRRMENDPLTQSIAATGNKEMSERGQKTAQGIADRAVNAGLMAVANAKPSPAAQEAQKVNEAVVAQERAKQVENARQTASKQIETGLREGSTSVTQVAQNIVATDAARKGEELTPKEAEAKVAQEVAAMKTMEPSRMADYAAYALIGGGLLASFFDKSGQASQLFHGSLNAALDRGLKRQAAQAAAQQQAIENRQAERGLDIKEAGYKETARSNQAKEGISRETLAETQRKNTIDEDLGNRRIDATLRGQDISAASSAADRASREGIASRRLAKEGKQQTGVPNSYKDNKEIATDYFKAGGYNVDSQTVGQVASQMATIQKLYPDLTTDQVMQTVLGGGAFEKTAGRKRPFFLPDVAPTVKTKAGLLGQ